MAYEIEKGVAITAPKNGWNARAAKYPWAQMSPGDSFFAPLSGYACRNGTPTVKKYAMAMSRIIGSRNKGGSARFIYRSEPDGLRIWRTA